MLQFFWFWLPRQPVVHVRQSQDARDNRTNAPVTAVALHVGLAEAASVQRRAVVDGPAGVALTRPADDK